VQAFYSHVIRISYPTSYKERPENPSIHGGDEWPKREEFAHKRAMPFKEEEKPVDDGRKAWRGQASPLHVRHDRYIKRHVVARLALARLSNGLFSTRARI